MVFIDTHAHLDDETFSGDNLKKALGRAKKEGVNYVIAPSTHPGSAQKLHELSSKFDSLYFASGLHCHQAKDFNEEGLKQVKQLLNSPTCVAIGEVGLDFHYDFSPPELQIDVLKRFLNLAASTDTPLILHCREAEEELFKLLSVYDKKLSGVVHCYTGPYCWAEKFVELGFYVGFTGIITFKKSGQIRETVSKIPINRILSETDSPYMTPVPHRGKKNEPAYVKLIVEEIARIKGASLENTARQLLENASRCFKLEDIQSI